MLESARFAKARRRDRTVKRQNAVVPRTRAQRAVVLGIAAQQSLGNVFAGLVLLFARPFGIGDHVRVRSGALGGIFEGWVTEMSLTYVSLEVEGAVFKIPNSAMLAAGVSRLPREVPPSVPSAGQAAASTAGGPGAVVGTAANPSGQGPPQ